VLLARPVAGHQRVGPQQLLDRASERPRAFAMDDSQRRQACEEGIVEVLFENVARFIRGAANQVNLIWNRPLAFGPLTFGPLTLPSPPMGEV
jgi:hypothetical protein